MARPADNKDVHRIVVKPNSKPQEQFFAASEYEVLFGGAAGGGKQLSLDTVLPTPTGYTTMRDVCPGDYVLSPRGEPVRVIAVSEIDDNAEAYAVTFSTGEVIHADGRHLWRTHNSDERIQVTRRTDAYRSRHRATRPSRALLMPSKPGVAKKVSELNRLRSYDYLLPHEGTVRTTAEIMETLAGRGGRYNHSVECTRPIELPEANLPIDPYLFGLWLGDGYSSCGSIGMAEADMQSIKPYMPTGTRYKTSTAGRNTPFTTASIPGLTATLKRVGALNNKHIPLQYLRASYRQRLALLQGIMDADGHCDAKDGRMEIGFSNLVLMQDTQELLSSLGIKAVITSKRAVCNGVDIGGCWRIQFASKDVCFRLPRKAARQRTDGLSPQTFRRYIVAIVKIDPEPMRCITVDHPDGMYLIGRTMIPTHNSWSIVVDPLRYISYGDFTAIIFRRTYPELEGSILPLAKYYYQAAGASYNDQKKTFTFPSGATIRLGFMQHEDDWTNYQGHEYAGQYFDELTNFTEAQYTQISPWNRSRAAGIPPYRRSSSNPGGVGHSWVKQRFVDLCPPVPDGEQRYSELGRMWWQPMKPGKTYCWKTENGMKLTRKFIPSRVFDNEDLLRKNPVYLAQLLSLPVERRKALLEGDWDVFEGQFFQFSKAVHVIEPFIPPADWPRVGGLDYGQRTVLEIQARDPEGRIVNFGEVYTEHQTPTERANQIAEYLLEREIYRLPIQYDTNMDLDLRHYSGYDKTQSAIFREVFAQRMGDKAPVMTVVSKSTTDRRGYRQVTNEAMKEYLRYEMGDDGKVLHRPMFLITSDCRRLIQTLPTLIHDPDSPDGLDFDQKVGVDDPYDAAKMALMWLRTPIAASAPKPAPPKTFADMMQPAYLDGIFNRKMKQAKRLRRVG